MVQSTHRGRFGEMTSQDSFIFSSDILDDLTPNNTKQTSDKIIKISSCAKDELPTISPLIPSYWLNANLIGRLYQLSPQNDGENGIAVGSRVTVREMRSKEFTVAYTSTIYSVYLQNVNPEVSDRAFTKFLQQLNFKAAYIPRLEGRMTDRTFALIYLENEGDLHTLVNRVHEIQDQNIPLNLYRLGKLSECNLKHGTPLSRVLIAVRRIETARVKSIVDGQWGKNNDVIQAILQRRCVYLTPANLNESVTASKPSNVTTLPKKQLHKYRDKQLRHISEEFSRLGFDGLWKVKRSSDFCLFAVYREAKYAEKVVKNFGQNKQRVNELGFNGLRAHLAECIDEQGDCIAGDHAKQAKLPGYFIKRDWMNSFPVKLILQRCIKSSLKNLVRGKVRASCESGFEPMIVEAMDALGFVNSFVKSGDVNFLGEIQSDSQADSVSEGEIDERAPEVIVIDSDSDSDRNDNKNDSGNSNVKSHPLTDSSVVVTRADDVLPTGASTSLRDLPDEKSYLFRLWPDDQGAKCCICFSASHSSVNCAQRTCGVCQKIDQHFTHACTAAQCVVSDSLKKRFRKGTDAVMANDNVPSQTDGSLVETCKRCGATNHRSEACAELWRSLDINTYDANTETTSQGFTGNLQRNRILKTRQIRMFCYACGSNEHFGDDCWNTMMNRSREWRRRKREYCNTFSQDYAKQFLHEQGVN